MKKLLFMIVVILSNLSPIACKGDGMTNEVALFQSVYANSLFDKSNRISRVFERGGSPQFIINNDKLYLKTQTTYTENNMYVVVDIFNWDKEKLAELLCAHKELKYLLPDPNSPKGGIKWL